MADAHGSSYVGLAIDVRYSILNPGRPGIAAASSAGSSEMSGSGLGTRYSVLSGGAVNLHGSCQLNEVEL